MLDGHHPPFGVWQAAVGGELVRHRVVRDLAHVIEQALPDGDLRDFTEMERFPFAPQHLYGGFREGHVRPGVQVLGNVGRRRRRQLALEATSSCRSEPLSMLKVPDSAMILVLP
jgi:hypothetical protein